MSHSCRKHLEPTTDNPAPTTLQARAESYTWSTIYNLSLVAITNFTMASSALSEARIGSVAMQLARTMELCDHDPLDEGTIRCWMEDLTASCFTFHESEEIVRQGVNLFKTKATLQPSTKIATNSISLWDQFSSFSERVMWDDILAAKEGAEQLSLLNKVDHIDDILTDWTEAQQLLQQGLEHDTESFLDCQATAEYQKIRIDLCCNILRETCRRFATTTYIVLAKSISFSSHEETSFKLLQTWKSMWIKIITSGAYDEDAADRMMLQALMLMRNLNVGCNNRGALLALLPAHFLAIVDIRADWLRSWLDETPIHRVLPILTRSNFLPDLLLRCQSKGTVSPSLDAESEVKTVIVDAGDDTTLETLEKILHKQSLSILSSMLLHMRVRMFPWNHLATPVSSLPQHMLLQSPMEADRQLQFPAPVMYKENQIFLVAEALQTSNCLNDDWLVEQSDLAFECLSYGCANDEQATSKLRDLTVGRKVVAPTKTVAQK